MPTCSLECTPQTGVDNTELFYNQYGECYTLREDGAYVCAVRFQVGSTESATEMTIHLYPRPDAEELAKTEPVLCPSTSGEARWSDEGEGHVILTVPVPQTTDTEWGWDYDEEYQPPKLKIKIRVKRMS